LVFPKQYLEENLYPGGIVYVFKSITGEPNCFSKAGYLIPICGDFWLVQGWCFFRSQLPGWY